MVNFATALISNHETTLRLGFFLSIFTTMVVWEFYTPCRPLLMSRWVRWSSNLGIVVLNSVVLRLLFPLAASSVALIAQQREWGVLNQLSLGSGAEWLIAIVVLDLAIYLQHRLFHKVPLLWRLHRMHHADLDYDVTTGARFHPLEIILSMLIKFAVVVLIGAPVEAVVLFEILLNATAMFNHGNIQLPSKVDQSLRLLIVTPDMHRVHHSLRGDETDSNFGFSLSWWDRWLGTYIAQPIDGHQQMVIGIPQFHHPDENRLHRMLTQPFRNDPNRVEESHP